MYHLRLKPSKENLLRSIVYDSINKKCTCFLYIYLLNMNIEVLYGFKFFLQKSLDLSFSLLLVYILVKLTIELCKCVYKSSFNFWTFSLTLFFNVQVVRLPTICLPVIQRTLAFPYKQWFSFFHEVIRLNL